jgi:hypothetical protein
MLAHFEIAAAFTDSRTASTAVAFLGATFFWLCVFHVGSDLPCGSSICLRPCGSDVTQVQEHFLGAVHRRRDYVLKILDIRSNYLQPMIHRSVSP